MCSWLIMQNQWRFRNDRSIVLTAASNPGQRGQKRLLKSFRDVSRRRYFSRMARRTESILDDETSRDADGHG
jgi:hypothetical protein